MKQFLKKVFLAAVLLTAILSIAFYALLMDIAPQYLQNYNASILDKIDRLKRLESPKIILVGHSNLSFGIDSALMEEAMGMPVVNLGLHGGLSNEFHENMAKYNIGEGDIVVICHSTYSNERSHLSDYALAWITLENHFELWPLVSLDEWPQMIAALPEYLQNAKALKASGEGNLDIGGAYSRSAFNEYGDVAWDRPEPEYEWSEADAYIPRVESRSIRKTNRFIRFCQQRGAKPVIAGYPIGNGEFTPDHALYTEAWEQLKSAVDCPVISDIEDYFLDYSYFYNTYLHLTNEGTRLRTLQLIDDLTVWQASGI